MNRLPCSRSALRNRGCLLRRPERWPPSRASSTTQGQGKLRGFNELELAFLQEEILDDACYLKPGVIALKRGDVVVDVGANVGVFSHQARQIVGCEGMILSVEALPPTFAVLQRNKDAVERCDGGWVLVNAAAGALDDGHTKMTFYPRAAGWGTSTPQQNTALMQNDLKQFINNMLDDRTSQVRPMSAMRKLLNSPSHRCPAFSKLCTR